MINFSEDLNLLEHCSYFAVSRSAGLSDTEKEYAEKLIIPPESSRHHPNRREEFLLGRYCASKAYEKAFSERLIHLPVGQSREPLWPVSVVGSISHNQNWVGAAVGKDTQLLGVGIDFETMGRVKPELISYITVAEDLKSVEGFSEAQLLTIIFSAKESLYKALYPSVKKFFGFESAAVTHIDIEKKSFNIRLIADLTPEFNSAQRSLFTGRFACDSQTCLTAIEVTRY